MFVYIYIYTYIYTYTLHCILTIQADAWEREAREQSRKFRAQFWYRKGHEGTVCRGSRILVDSGRQPTPELVSQGGTCELCWAVFVHFGICEVHAGPVLTSWSQAKSGQDQLQTDLANIRPHGPVQAKDPHHPSKIAHTLQDKPQRYQKFNPKSVQSGNSGNAVHPNCRINTDYKFDLGLALVWTWQTCTHILHIVFCSFLFPVVLRSLRTAWSMTILYWHWKQCSCGHARPILGLYGQSCVFVGPMLDLCWSRIYVDSLADSMTFQSV